MNEAYEVGPRCPHYSDDIEVIANALDMGKFPVHVAFVANLYRYGMLLIPKSAVASYGQPPQGIGPYGPQTREGEDGEWTFLDDNSYTHVVVLQGTKQGAYSFRVGTWHEPNFVNNRLFRGELDPLDALAIAGFLNRIERARVALNAYIERDRREPMFADLELLEWREFESMPFPTGYIESDEGMEDFISATGVDRPTVEKFRSGSPRASVKR